MYEISRNYHNNQCMFQINECLCIHCFIFGKGFKKTHADYTLISLKYHIYPTIIIGRLTLQSSLAEHIHLHSDIFSYHKVPQAPAEFDEMCLNGCLILNWQDSGPQLRKVIQRVDDWQMPRSSTASVLQNKDDGCHRAAEGISDFLWTLN